MVYIGTKPQRTSRVLRAELIKFIQRRGIIKPFNAVISARMRDYRIEWNIELEA